MSTDTIDKHNLDIAALSSSHLTKNVSFCDDTTILIFDEDEPTSEIPLCSDVQSPDEGNDTTNVCEEQLITVIRTKLPDEVKVYCRLDLSLQIPRKYKKVLEEEFNMDIEDIGMIFEDVYVYEFWKR